MRSQVWLAAAVGAVSLALAGCEGSDPEDQPSEAPEAVAGKAPEVGTCWAVDPALAVDQQYLYDDSARVPCTEPHTTETAWTVRLDEFTPAAVKQVVDGCWEPVLRYVGIDETSWVPWGYFVYGPSKEEVADGASWLRCDAVFPETWATEWTGARSITVAAAGLANDPPEDFWACLDQPPTKSGQPFVPCDQPHGYEQTGTLALLDGGDQYPAAAELAAEARQQCRPGVPEGHEDASVTAQWDPREFWTQNTTLAGVCFIFNADGQPLPAR